MSKRSPEDILKDIEGSDVDDAIERVTSMSPDQRKKELEAAGFTEAELRSKADALYERMQAAAVEEGKKRLEAEARAKSLRPPAPRARVVLLVAAAVVAAIVVALLLLPRPRAPETPSALPTATAPPSATIGAQSPSPSAPLPDASTSPGDKPPTK